MHMKRVALFVCTAALLLTGCTGGSGGSTEPTRPGQGTALQQAKGVYARIPGIVDRVGPSVVTIFVDGGLGSGVVFKKGGIIVTNAHVVGNAEQVRIGLADGSRIDGTVVATDKVTDLAVIRAEREDLSPAEFSTRLPDVGELVIAMGSPLGYQNSATAGIVSGLNRSLPNAASKNRALVDLIQTDAAISPGNSGGALVGAGGKVVGINEAYIPPERGAVSIGFAIPAATVVDTANELLRTGSATHPYLGFVPAKLTPRLKQALDIQVDGVVVRKVVDGGPADEAGIRPGDVITRFNGQRIRSVSQLLGAKRDVEPGQQVQLTRYRDGQKKQLTMTVGRFRTE